MIRFSRTTPTTAGTAGTSLFRRTYEAMLGGRQTQARPYATYFLLGLDDAALHELGYDRRSLERRGPGRDPI